MNIQCSHLNTFANASCIQCYVSASVDFALWLNQLCQSNIWQILEIKGHDLFDDKQINDQCFKLFAIDNFQGIRTPYLDSSELTSYPSYTCLMYDSLTNIITARIRTDYLYTLVEFQTEMVLNFSANQLHNSVIEFINWSNIILEIFYEDPEFERSNLFRMWNIGSNPDLDDNLVQQE